MNVLEFVLVNLHLSHLEVTVQLIFKINITK